MWFVATTKTQKEGYGHSEPKHTSRGDNDMKIEEWRGAGAQGFFDVLPTNLQKRLKMQKEKFNHSGMETALKAAPLCEFSSVRQFLSNQQNPFYSLCGSLDMNSLAVMYEELAKDEDVSNDVDEETNASS